MPRKTPKVTKLLSQLSGKELLHLSKKKGLRIPDDWSKKKVVETLSVYVTESDVIEAVAEKTRAKTAEGRGYESKMRGEKLERKVSSILEEAGYECKVNVREPGVEFDIIGFKKGSLFKRDKWIFVECKNMPKVIPADFKKFIGNFEIFCRRKGLDKEEVEGVLYTTGVFDIQVKKDAGQFPNIKLKRIRLGEFSTR
jgi:ABC-type ATPase with predicted acetyltransferase domain